MRGWSRMPCGFRVPRTASAPKFVNISSANGVEILLRDSADPLPMAVV
jgi:hypothetical protein